MVPAVGAQPVGTACRCGKGSWARCCTRPAAGRRRPGRPAPASPCRGLRAPRRLGAAAARRPPAAAAPEQPAGAVGGATSGLLEAAWPTLEVLQVPARRRAGGNAGPGGHAKPDPDLFLAAAKRLGVDITDAVVVGHSVWDLLAARRARRWSWAAVRWLWARGAERAGAYRVYDAPAGLLAHLDEVESAPRLRRPADRSNEPWPGTGRAKAHQAPSTGIS